MTKSLGRTYSLLDFSGREMHYWPGNLPRRRVGVASPGTLYVRCYRALHSLVLVFREDATCHRLFLFFSLASPWRSIRQSSRCAYIADVILKGDARRLCRTCVKSLRVLVFPQTAMSLSESTRNLRSEIHSRDTVKELQRHMK